MDETIRTLLDDIKSSLNITWSDKATDDRVGGFIRSGIAFLNKKCGCEADYLSEGYPRMLLFEFVRYARDNALDVFEDNYLSWILAMQREKAVMAYAETDSVSSEE